MAVASARGIRTIAIAKHLPIPAMQTPRITEDAEKALTYDPGSEVRTKAPTKALATPNLTKDA
jgi:hypothetical protein